MTLDDVILKLEEYGYSHRKSYAHDLSTSFIPEEERVINQELQIRFIWPKSSSPYKIYQEDKLDFRIFETDSVCINGILYYTPGELKYYCYFHSSNSRVYKEDELDILLLDVQTQLSSYMDKNELRNMKLLNIGL